MGIIWNDLTLILILLLGNQDCSSGRPCRRRRRAQAGPGQQARVTESGVQELTEFNTVTVPVTVG